LQYNKYKMPKKGKAKNTLNKAKHTKLMTQKINRVKLEKQRTKDRLKALIKKVNEQKNEQNSDEL
jgi:5,10-methylene-tetrahydrofolate dehydrogenase/methenyl tetrahydrofolate cyclohydrolase